MIRKARTRESTRPIDPAELRYEFFRSSGPGGQNVNKVSTAVRLLFDVRKSGSIPEDAKQRLTYLAGRRLRRDGVLVIEAQRFRTQEANRQDALVRLTDLVRRALRRPKQRRPTKPTLVSEERRLEDKRRRGSIKRGRRPAARLEPV